MTTTVNDMADNIMRNLEKNGFPGNPVALPLERLYESAHNAGLNFNKVLDFLQAKGVANTKTAEKIIFSKAVPLASNAPPNQPSPNQPSNEPSSGFSGIDLDSIKKMDFSKLDLNGLNVGSMMSQATEMMKNMSGSQLSELKQMFDKMSPDERANLINKVKSVIPS
jgi:hypothetical protein